MSKRRENNEWLQSKLTQAFLCERLIFRLCTHGFASLPRSRTRNAGENEPANCLVGIKVCVPFDYSPILTVSPFFLLRARLPLE